MQQNYRGGLPYTELLDRCRKLRRDETDAERLLWRLLRGRQVAGAKFRRQHQFGPVILDFFCVEANMAIEVDGSQHYSDDGLARDESRTAWLARAGVRVLRFDNRQVLIETESVLATILLALTTGTNPHPSPLPEGEGV